ncbi:hypothetical protein [Lactococcus garvieae]|uniref:hypothetical protein n=1 Tax=Lactococcus garvieae TaxID=1363 RepID=UPI00398ED4FA
MKFTKINLKAEPFTERWNHYTDFENWHKFIKANELVDYCRKGLPNRSTLKYYFENYRDVGKYLRTEENHPPAYDHGYMYRTKDRVPLIVYQPYGNPKDIESYREEIEQWATERGIQAKVFGFDYGWYNSSCYLVVMGLDLSNLKVEKVLNAR